MAYFTHQTHCRISGESLSEASEIVRFDQLPIPGLFFGESKTGLDKRIPLTLVQSSCGLLQLKENLDPDLYFYYKSRRADQNHLDWNASVAHQIAARFTKDARILEVGGGEGLLLKDLFEKGYQTLNNVDPSHENEAQSYFEPIVGLFPDALESETYSGTFDCIVGMHFLEHVPDPVRVLKESARLLKKDGEVWIEVPDMESSALESYFQIGIIYPLHLSYFTRSTLQKAGKEAGLILQSIEVVDHYGKSLWAKFSKNGSSANVPEDHPDMVPTIRKYFAELKAFAIETPGEIVAWGAAERALTTAAILGEYGIKITALYDSNPEIKGMYVSGLEIPVKGPESFSQETDHLLILSPPNHRSIVNGIRDRLSPSIQIHVPLIGHLSLSDYE